MALEPCMSNNNLDCHEKRASTLCRNVHVMHNVQPMAKQRSIAHTDPSNSVLDDFAS